MKNIKIPFAVLAIVLTIGFISWLNLKSDFLSASLFAGIGENSTITGDENFNSLKAVISIRR